MGPAVDTAGNRSHWISLAGLELRGGFRAVAGNGQLGAFGLPMHRCNLFGCLGLGFRAVTGVFAAPESSQARADCRLPVAGWPESDIQALRERLG